MEEYIPKDLPLNKDFETKEILKKVAKAHTALAELKGVSKIIPSQAILINALSLQEAKDSSEIENIITTHDELYKAMADNESLSKEAKEVQNYSSALFKGFQLVKENELLLVKHILNIQEELEENNAGIRKQGGTKLRNLSTGEVTYVPPQYFDDITRLLGNLEKYINDDELDEHDVLIKMALIHYQFESIHPFYDGNGRTGRIINILYLVLKGYLDLPILYLSKYIIRHKSDYYRLLQEVRTKDSWEEWIMYMLDGIEQTSKDTITLINDIKVLMDETKTKIRSELPKIYSKDLLEVIFLHPYTKTKLLVDKLGIHRDTATTHLKKLEKIGVFESIKIGNTYYFINKRLYSLLVDAVSS